MITRDFLGKGFFGNRHFDITDRQKFIEEWENMPDSEKLDIMNKKIAAFKEGKCERDFITVEHIDSHCEEWMSKSTEEKEKLVAEIKEKFEKRRSMMKEHFSHHGFDFGHGFFGRGRNQGEPTE